MCLPSAACERASSGTWRTTPSSIKATETGKSKRRGPALATFTQRKPSMLPATAVTGAMARSSSRTSVDPMSPA